VAALNEPGELRFYPGSPRIIRSLLRPQDRLLASELNSSEYARLEQEFFGDQRVDTRHQDAYDSVEAWLPPPHDGGLVLFDPTFQRGDECAQLIATLGHAYQRWPTGTFAAWYPITARGEPNQLRDAVGAHNMTKILTAELTVTASADAKQLTGCGMLLVNSPTDVDARLDSVLHWLWTQLSVDPDTGIELHRLAPSR
jgi:23S rRNA (adenine2030-N6)-methyltransferase